MSTAYSSAKQQYIGNGVTTEWGFDFPIKKHSELKVYLKRSGLSQVLLEEGVDYSFVTENTIAFPIKTGEAKLQAADVLALQRESVFESEYNFSNQQRLEPEEVMHADDNLERQIQELKRDSESAIKVLPTSNVDPNTLFEQVDRVYGSVDNIDTVANDKANVDAVAGSITNVNTVSGDIESVKTVANNIESVVVDATNISDIKTVAGSIANVNKTAGSIDNVNAVAPSISSVNTVAANISSVNTAASNMAAIQAAPTAATNAAQSAAQAANSATISANSAIWAEGTDAQVQALGGVHSSKGWAEQSTNANIALTNSPYTTNRILEIPQDIKLELNNGTLTLKAGSKVYVPNGFEADGTTPKFDTVIISNDTTFTINPDNLLSIFYTNIGLLYNATTFQVFSGGTAPTGQTYMTWYDTTNNIIKMTTDGGSTWVSHNTSFPLCILSSKSVIDQVFNGFGYIGSTVFALPGVKVQIPNGRNEDGTCKSLITNITSVKTLTVNASWGTYDIFITHNGGIGRWPDIASGSAGTRYNAATNYYEVIGDGKWIPQLDCVFAKIKTDTTSPYKITYFEPFTVDSVLNSNLSNLSAAGQAKFDEKANVSNTVTTNTAQTITGIKTLKNVVIAETENINFVAKNPTMDSTKVPSSPKYTGYDFRDKNNVRVGYIGIKQDSSGSFIYEIQTPNGLASAIHGITPASATENSKAMPTTAWIANQHKKGYGIGLPNYASPTTLSWGTSYTSATAPQVNGWLYFGGTSTDSDYLLLTMNGFTFNAGAISGAAGFHTLFIPYQAKTAFSTSGGTSGQFLKFFSSL